MDTDVVVVGAGVAGLRCALELQKQGFQVLVLEASDGPGGRIRTDEVNGYRLDRGFQVLLTAYDECSQVLDYSSLKLGHFEPGALVWTGSEMAKVIDPWRRPGQLFRAAFSPVGTFKDKLRVGRLRNRLSRSALEEIYQKDEKSTLDYLVELGFSEAFIQRFFKPFYAGIFLEPELATSNAMFEFVFKMFGKGYAALPEGGMQALPDQLCGLLTEGSVRFETPVTRVFPKSVTVEGGVSVNARQVVLAVDMTAASRLLESGISDRGWNRTQCTYFSADQSPLPEPIITLNGTGGGIITNVAVPSDVCAGYVPDGKALICVSTASVVSEDALRTELKTWFGAVVDTWQVVEVYEIPHSLPRQLPGDNAFGKADLQTESGIWLCGDYRYSSSTQGAMASGRMVGEALAESLETE